MLEDSAVLQGRLQCCGVTVSAKDLNLPTQRVTMQNFSYIQSIEKWLRYRLLDYAVLHGILQSAGQCSGPFHLEGIHAKFQLRLFRVSVVGWVAVDSDALLSSSPS